jgi:transketolase, bacterial and yeast
MSDLEQRGINVIRALALDAVQQAKSGHQGTAMALAPLAHVLFTRIMDYDATEPNWPDRDRFVLSAGHASILLYSMLHLTGFGLELDDLRAFRQWGSHTPGHPEYGHTAGVEVTTGPLGQGIANAVGMAIAEENLRARFSPELTNHHTFVIAGDGCLSEGVSHEASSLAGHLGLGRLIAIYDDNHVTIDGPTELSLSDNAPERFRAYGWHVVELGEVANDLDAIERGIRDAMAEPDRPSLVVLRSHIGYPSPKFTDSPKAHGNPFDADEIRVVKELMELPPDEQFFVPDDVSAYYRTAGLRGATRVAAWNERIAIVRSREPGLVDDYDACIAGGGKTGWEAKIPSWPAGPGPATREACKDILDAIVDVVPGLVGGGADLTGNTGTAVPDGGVIEPGKPAGRQIYFGVREHGMGAVMNGMSVSGLLPFGGTFFVFSDYMRGAVRVAALSGYKTAFVWSHDSVGVGEDGPTHQPVEQLAALRAMPGLPVIRPADANETAAAWRAHVNGDGPTAMVLSRQKLPVLDGTAERAVDGVAGGAYVLSDAPDGLQPALVLIGTGSEVWLCVDAAAVLRADGIATRVVSMPCWEHFEARSLEEQAAVLPPGTPTLAVEAGVGFGWERYADDVVAMHGFGASAPGDVALREFGFTVDNVVARARALLGEGS